MSAVFQLKRPWNTIDILVTGFATFTLLALCVVFLYGLSVGYAAEPDVKRVLSYCDTDAALERELHDYCVKKRALGWLRPFYVAIDTVWNYALSSPYVYLAAFGVGNMLFSLKAFEWWGAQHVYVIKDSYSKSA